MTSWATSRTRRAGAREEVVADAAALSDLRSPAARSPRTGIRANVRVALAYLDAWLHGIGAAAIDNLMEDAATAEISPVAALAVAVARDPHARAVRAHPRRGAGPARWRRLGRLAEAADLLDRLVLDERFADFLTQRAYAILE